MQIVKPSVSILTPIDGEAVLKHLEACGRVCYKSEGRTTEESCYTFVKNIIKRGHEAVLEHYSVTVKFICDRGVSHELVRHRIASFCQESTRYCNYSRDVFQGEITVVEPNFAGEHHLAPYRWWERSCKEAEHTYFTLLDYGWSPQQARTVLPTSLKTEVVMTANLREWRHFFKLRCDAAAHPQMREVATQLLEQMQKAIPVVFDDLILPLQLSGEVQA